MTATVWTWLRDTGHVYTALVGATVGMLMTLVVVGMILRPLARRVRAAWHAHESTQQVIADRLDPTTPGGITEIVSAIKDSETP